MVGGCDNAADAADTTDNDDDVLILSDVAGSRFVDIDSQGR